MLNNDIFIAYIPLDINETLNLVRFKSNSLIHF